MAGRPCARGPGAAGGEPRGEAHSVLLVHGYCEGGWLLDTHEQQEVRAAMVGRCRLTL